MGAPATEGTQPGRARLSPCPPAGRPLDCAAVRILFLSQRVPYPPNRGDKISCWHLIERMARRHEVQVVAFAHDEADRRAARTLEEKGFDVASFPLRPRWRSLPLLATARPLTLGFYGSARLQAEVDRRVAGCDMAYAFSSSMGAFLLPHPLPWVMHFAELDSDKWRQYAGRTAFPMSWVYRREWRTLFAFEQRLAAAALQNVFCTPLEQRIFQERIPGRPSLVVRNGVDLDSFRPAPELAEPRHLIFVGVMDYYPNVEGCLWFCRDVLPRLRERFPDVRLSIVGAHPTQEVRRLGEIPGVTVTGFVEDTRDWLRRASVSIAPLRIARGIQNKVLEALAMGLPVVGTTSATQGVEGQAGRDFLVADDADAQVEALAGLLAEPERARELGRRGRAFVEETYDWEVCLAPLDAVLDEVAAAGAPGALRTGARPVRP